MALARAHCRSGDPVLLSAYMWENEASKDAMADFAAAYADQAERDHEAMVAAVRAGRIAIRSEASALSDARSGMSRRAPLHSIAHGCGPCSNTVASVPSMAGPGSAAIRCSPAGSRPRAVTH